MLQDLFADAGFEPRVVITLRGLASTIPSEWQQFLKHRITLDYATFLERVRDRKGPWARHFWTRQDAVAMCERWSAVVGADRVDVVVTPPRSRDPEGLYRMFGAVVGFDPAAMQWPERDVNASWGMVEAEVYRRLNVVLGDRLPRYEQAYQPAVRWPLIGARCRAARAPGSRCPRSTCPGWSRRPRSRRAGCARAASGSTASPRDLVPGTDAAAPLPEVDEAEVAAAAVATLANFAVHTHRQRRRTDGEA